MPGSRGSAQVEAAILIPLVILVVAGMIKLSTELFDKVVVSSENGCSHASALATGGVVATESILRGRWHFK